MSLAGIFGDWHYHNAELLKTDIREDEYGSVELSTALEQAKNDLSLTTPDGEKYVVPLFKKDRPVPTNEYVLYRPEYEHVGWFDSGFGISGSERFADCEQVNDTEIGRRLRFWLPSNQPEPELDIPESQLPAENIHPEGQLSQQEEDEFFDELEAFVRSEREAERERNWETYDELGFAEAYKRNQLSGPFIGMGRWDTSGGDWGFRYQIALDDDEDDIDLRGDEGLFEDNLCIADTDTDEDSFPIEVRIHRVKNQQIKISPENYSNPSEREIFSTLRDDNTTIWFYDLLNPVPYDRRINAIRQVKKNQRKKSILTGQCPAEFSVNQYNPVESKIEINHHQRIALVWAKGANDAVCIHGPPGTGKTRTLTAYALVAVACGQRVLVAAHSNQAVDNLLVGESTTEEPEENTLHAFAQHSDQNISIARAGSNSQNRVVQSNYIGRSTGNADIVAATTNGAAKFDSNDFDVAIVDEATQASRPATAIALNAAKKLVLAGDHKQLPPFCADETSQKEETRISLFEYLLNRYDKKISIMLQKQYRMNEQIAEFPNRSFYKNNLVTANQNQHWTVSDLNPVIGIDIDGQERRETHGQSYYNVSEAEAVTKQVKLLIQNGISANDIGVITAYSGQVGQIGSRVNQLDVDNPRGVNIDTVDSFQGGEREAIIVSFVRSNSEGYSGFLEFPKEGPQRLNVAITRAKRRLVLVGDWDTLGQIAPHRSSENSCAPLYLELDSFLRSNDLMISK